MELKQVYLIMTDLKEFCISAMVTHSEIIMNEDEIYFEESFWLCYTAELIRDDTISVDNLEKVDGVCQLQILVDALNNKLKTKVGESNYELFKEFINKIEKREKELSEEWKLYLNSQS